MLSFCFGGLRCVCGCGVVGCSFVFGGCCIVCVGGCFCFCFGGCCSFCFGGCFSFCFGGCFSTCLCGGSGFGGSFRFRSCFRFRSGFCPGCRRLFRGCFLRLAFSGSFGAGSGDRKSTRLNSSH